MLSEETQNFISTEVNSISAEVHQVFAWRISLSVLPRVFIVSETAQVPDVSPYQLMVFRTALATSVSLAAQHLNLFRKPKFFRFPRLQTLDSVYRTALAAFETSNSKNGTFENFVNCIDWAAISYDADDFRLRLETINNNIEHSTIADLFPNALLRPLVGLPKSGYDHWTQSAEYNDTNTWHFWRDWYQGFLDGKPLDWELQRRVALIPDADWEQGPEHIAELIEDIRRDFESDQPAAEPRAPEHEPDNVEQLFKHPLSVSASLHLSSQTVLQGLEAFRRESGLNETPEVLLPLEAMPVSLERIRTILLNSQKSEDSEQLLKFEIGRLNAKVAQLESELAKLRSDLEQQQKSWVKSLKYIGAGIGSVVAFTWVLSGEDKSLEDRVEKITKDYEYLFPAEPPHQNAVEQPTLPPTTDT